MEGFLVTAGVVCLIGAVVGGGLKAFGVDMPAVKSIGRQFLVGVLGLFLLSIGVGIGAGKAEHADAQTSPTADSSATASSAAGTVDTTTADTAAVNTTAPAADTAATTDTTVVQGAAAQAVLDAFTAPGARFAGHWAAAAGDASVVQSMELSSGSSGVTGTYTLTFADGSRLIEYLEPTETGQDRVSLRGTRLEATHPEQFANQALFDVEASLLADGSSLSVRWTDRNGGTGSAVMARQ